MFKEFSVLAGRGDGGEVTDDTREKGRKMQGWLPQGVGKHKSNWIWNHLEHGWSLTTQKMDLLPL